MTGADSIDNFNELLDKWKKEGGDAMTEAINSWYKEAKNK